MSAYDWSQFHIRMYYLAPLSHVFRFFSTAAGLQSFFIYKATHLGIDGIARSPDEQVQTGTTTIGATSTPSNTEENLNGWKPINWSDLPLVA